MLLREYQKESSRFLVVVGELRPPGLKGFESSVSRLRVPGRVADDGELTANEFPDPCENDGFRPFTAPGLFVLLFPVGGLRGELISVINA